MPEILIENNQPVVYIAGKVTDLPYDEVYAKFMAKQLELEAQNFIVLNPCMHIDKNEHWETAMRQALKLLLDADFICLLPDWADSKGAKLERDLALCLNIPTINE
jgi:hypothetical protein